MAAADDPDLELVLALQAGDDQALARLMLRHEEALFRFLYRYLLNATDAADLAQETFVRVYFKIRQFRPEAKFSVWLYRIALNLVRDHARSHALRHAALTEERPDEESAPPPAKLGELADSKGHSPSAALEIKEELHALQDAIDGLPPDLKQAFILVALEGYTQKDCGAMVGASPKAVETRVYRARKLLVAKIRLDSP